MRTPVMSQRPNPGLATIFRKSNTYLRIKQSPYDRSPSLNLVFCAKRKSTTNLYNFVARPRSLAVTHNSPPPLSCRDQVEIVDDVEGHHVESKSNGIGHVAN